MFRIKVRIDGKWFEFHKGADRITAVAVYNSCGYHPKMFIGPNGIEHKQYTKNGYRWNG